MRGRTLGRRNAAPVQSTKLDLVSRSTTPPQRPAAGPAAGKGNADAFTHAKDCWQVARRGEVGGASRRAGNPAAIRGNRGRPGASRRSALGVDEALTRELNYPGEVGDVSAPIFTFPQFVVTLPARRDLPRGRMGPRGGRIGDMNGRGHIVRRARTRARGRASRGSGSGKGRMIPGSHTEVPLWPRTTSLHSRLLTFRRRSTPRPLLARPGRRRPTRPRPVAWRPGSRWPRRCRHSPRPWPRRWRRRPPRSPSRTTPRRKSRRAFTAWRRRSPPPPTSAAAPATTSTPPSTWTRARPWSWWARKTPGW